MIKKKSFKEAASLVEQEDIDYDSVRGRDSGEYDLQVPTLRARVDEADGGTTKPMSQLQANKVGRSANVASPKEGRKSPLGEREEEERINAMVIFDKSLENDNVREYSAKARFSEHVFHMSADMPIDPYGNELGSQIIAIEGVESITVNAYRVSITKAAAYPWEEIHPQVVALLEAQEKKGGKP